MIGRPGHPGEVTYMLEVRNPQEHGDLEVGEQMRVSGHGLPELGSLV